MCRKFRANKKIAIFTNKGSIPSVTRRFELWPLIDPTVR